MAFELDIEHAQTTAPITLDPNWLAVTLCRRGVRAARAAHLVTSHTDVSATPLSGAWQEIERLKEEVEKSANEVAALNTALSDGVRTRDALALELTASRADLMKSETKLLQSKAAEENARHLALHDAVTGLPNSVLFSDRLNHALIQAERHAWRVVIMFIDLDRFKTVNDSYGHDVGDRVLYAVGQRLQASVRAGDTLSRRSGDEFLYLMLEAKDEASIENLARKIGDAVAEPFQVGALSLTVTASIGVAIYPKHARSAEALLKKADAAMYSAKRANRGDLLFGQVRKPEARGQEFIGSKSP
jgi:diguanylate cyclase (GGDEF)-like protein